MCAPARKRLSRPATRASAGPASPISPSSRSRKRSKTAEGLEDQRRRRYMRLDMTQHFQIRLPDGSVREVEPGTTPADVAAAIGPGLAKAAMAARVNGELRDLNRPFEED